MIAAGELEWVVSIYRRQTLDDGFSSAAGEAVFLTDRWAKKTDVSDGERIAAAAQQQSITSRFLVRFDDVTSAIRASDQIECEGVRYEVVGVKEARGRRVGIEITASALR